MEYKLSPEDEAFRDRLRSWLDDNVPAMPRSWSDDRERADFLRAWQRKRAEAGFIAPAWPKEHGGMGATVVQQAIYNEEIASRRVPPLIGQSGIDTVGPVLMQHGNEEQQRHLPKILHAEELWCQGFSEPDAGSDLASLKTSARRDGDFYVINGQKVWTTNAHIADWIYVLCRTDPDVPKHRGLSLILIDMQTPGIAVSPLKQISGEAHFNQVFFEDVRVPVENIVGEENQGWTIAMTALNFERSGLAGTLASGRTLTALVKLAKKTVVAGRPRYEDDTIRRTLAQFAIEIEALRQLGYRTLTVQSQGGVPGPEASVGKLMASELQKRMSEFAMDILGPYGALTAGPKYVVNRGAAARGFLASRAATFGGGTSEIQRNVIAERILGQPKD